MNQHQLTVIQECATLSVEGKISVECSGFVQRAETVV